jgi:hypothetical protein
MEILGERIGVKIGLSHHAILSSATNYVQAD